MMCAKLVADCKIRTGNVRWARGKSVRQAGKEESRMFVLLFLINCLLVAGLKFALNYNFVIVAHPVIVIDNVGKGIEAGLNPAPSPDFGTPVVPASVPRVTAFQLSRNDNQRLGIA